MANQIATLGVQEGWVREFTRATYRRWFENVEPAGEEPNNSASLTEVGLEPVRVLAAAQSESIEKALAREIDEAMKAGIFGSPTFVVGPEIFWGDDRLEDAVFCAAG